MGNCTSNLGNGNASPPKPLTDEVSDVDIDAFVEARGTEAIKSMLYPKGPIRDVNVTSNEGKGWTCLMHQCSVGNDEAVKYLLADCKANPDIQSNEYNLFKPRDSALLLAVKGKYPNIVKHLLDAGADRKIILDSRSRGDALNIAESKSDYKGDEESMKLLKEYFPETKEALLVAEKFRAIQALIKEKEDKMQADIDRKKDEEEILWQAQLAAKVLSINNEEKEKADLRVREDIKRDKAETAHKLHLQQEEANEKLRLMREEAERERIAKEVKEKAEADRIENERKLREEFDCTICYDSKLLSNSIICTSGQNHRICQECFWGDAQNQINEGKFPSRSRKIVCSQCLFNKKILPFLPYEDDLAMQLISRDRATLELHQKAIVDCVRSETESKAEAEKVAMRLKHENELMQLRIAAEQDVKKRLEAAVALHNHRIFNEIIVTKCPHCDLAFADWEHCFAVEHAVEYTVRGNLKILGCRNFFCGWCLEKFPDTILAHRHVPNCPKNIRWGAVYGEEGDFKNHVEPLMRKEKVEKYLTDLRASGEVSAQVIDMLLLSIKEGLKDIGVEL